MKKLILVSLLAFTLMSCEKKTEENTNKEETKMETKATESKSGEKESSESKDFNSKIEIPNEIVKMNPTDITLTLSDKDNKPVENAEIEADLSMPDMEMPENKVILKHTSGGVYKGTAIFTMKGNWLIKAEIKVGDKELESKLNTTVK